MAMTLPIVLPSTPSSGNSPASDNESNNVNPPRTPISPSMQPANGVPNTNGTAPSTADPSQAANGATAPNGQIKRKPSRRANTAERRATHNAVERQRRETLNGRFLDLAALLPNLSQIRRPSKSSIVNSSIAHIHASRRHRILAARELRLLKLEADALRRELNEWRDRAGIPRIEEPLRGDGFSMVLSGELEVIAAVPGEEDDDEDGMGGGSYGGYMVADDDLGEDGYPHAGVMGHGHHQQSPVMDDMEDPRIAAAMMMKGAPVNSNPFAHSLPPPVVTGSNGGPPHLAHILPRPSQNGMHSSPTFETAAAAAMYEQAQFSGNGNGYMQQAHHHQGHPQQQQHHHQQQQQVDPEKLAAYHMYNQQQQQAQMVQAQRSLFTPPATSHGLPTPTSTTSTSGPNANNGGSSSGSAPNSSQGGNGGSNPFNDPASQAFFANFQRQQQAAMQQQQQHGHNGRHMGNNGYASPERDDASSIGSSGNGRIIGGRERSGSVSAHSAHSAGSGYGGSPPHHGHGGGASPVGHYELAGEGGQYVTGISNGGAGSGGVPRRGSTHVPSGWAGRVDGGVDAMVGVHHGHGGHGGHGHGGHMLASPISAGGGGGGGGFAMMM